MIIIATVAFARTLCRDCGDLIKVGQQITSAVDGFRHGECVTVVQREMQGCSPARVFIARRTLHWVDPVGGEGALTSAPTRGDCLDQIPRAGATASSTSKVQESLEDIEAAIDAVDNVAPQHPTMTFISDAVDVGV